MSSRNRKILGVGAAFALALTFSVTQLTVGAAADPSAGPTIDGGQLRLHMSTDGNAFTYFDSGGTQVATQAISQKQQCSYSSGTNLVTASATGGSVGFIAKNEQLGVDSKDGGSKCTQVNPGEKLTLELMNASGTTMTGLYATHAQLDLEFKYSPLITVTAYNTDSATPSTPVWSETYDCSKSDCGPDRSVDGDNVYEPFPKTGTVLFDKLEITAAATGSSTGSAGVSLEGGNDLYSGGVRHDSIFYMATPAEGTICPGQTVSEFTGTGTATVQYISPTGDCKAYLLTYTRDPATNDRSLTFLTGGSSSIVTFDVKVFSWDPEPVANPVPATLVDPPSPAHPGQWCNGTPASPSMPSGEVWCLITQTTSTYGPDGDGVNSIDWVPNYDGQLMQVQEEWLLQGDSRIQR